MKVRYKQAKGNRIKKGSIRVDNGLRKFKINNFFELRPAKYGDFYWCEEVNKWLAYDDVKELNTSSHNANIRNLKQAIRHLKKQTDIPKGSKFILESNFEGFDIYIII